MTTPVTRRSRPRSVGPAAAVAALTLIATLTVSARPPAASAATSPFTDIVGTTFEADIDWLYAEGITVGCSPTAYCPERPVSRGEMASFLVRMFDLADGWDIDAFGDDDGTTHEQDINRLAHAGITQGCTETTFCPTAPVRRDAMASFLARAIPLTDGAGNDYFRDDNGTTHEADIDRAAAAGVTTGCAAWRFCPAASVTRGQMAGFLHRVETPVTPPPYPAPSGPLYVETTGSDDENDCLAEAAPCRTIAHAIAEAWPRESIQVGAGTFNEGTLILQEDLTIVGDPDGGTIIDASGGGERTVFHVYGDRNVVLSDLTLTGGSSQDSGGAIWSAGHLTIIDSTIHHNRAHRGGAIATIGGSLTIVGSTLRHNEALAGDGGAILYRGDLTIVNTTMFGNHAAEAGGGIMSGGCAGPSCPLELVILNSTFTENSAAAIGGVGTDGYGTAVITNTIIAGNTASFQWDDFLDGDAAIVASIIGIPAGLTLAGILDPAGLQDNGGPTETIALTDSASNPAIDSGDAATCADAPVSGLDQRGLPRTPPCDIGGYELQP